MRLQYIPAIGVLLATSLTVAACGTVTGSHLAAAPSAGKTSPSSTRQGSPAADPTHTAANPTYTAADPTHTAANPTHTAAKPTDTGATAAQADFNNALAAWKSAAAAPMASINTYFQQAANDLRASGDSHYDTAISQLTYLSDLPATNDTSAQQAKAHSDTEALDSFFGTPGLMS